MDSDDNEDTMGNDQDITINEENNDSEETFALQCENESTLDAVVPYSTNESFGNFDHRSTDDEMSTSPFTVKKSWSYREVLNFKHASAPSTLSSKTRPRIKVKLKKPTVPNSSRSRSTAASSHSSPYDRMLPRKRSSKYVSSKGTLKKNFLPSYILAKKNAAENDFNGGLSMEKATVPIMPSLPGANEDKLTTDDVEIVKNITSTSHSGEQSVKANGDDCKEPTYPKVPTPTLQSCNNKNESWQTVDRNRRSSYNSDDELEEEEYEEDPFLSSLSTLDIIGVGKKFTITVIDDKRENDDVTTADATENRTKSPINTAKSTEEPSAEVHVPQLSLPSPKSDVQGEHSSLDDQNSLALEQSISLPTDTDNVTIDRLNTSEEIPTNLETDDNLSTDVNGHTTPPEETKSSSWLDNLETKPFDEPPPPPPAPVEPEPPPLPVSMALMLDDSVETLSIEKLISECVRTSCLTCSYCYHATVIAINGSKLASHLLVEHRYVPTKNADDASLVLEKLQLGVEDLISVYMNATYSSHQEIIFDGTFICSQCSFSTTLFKDLLMHKRRVHHKVIFLCVICKCNFQFYSQFLCHMCPGVYSAEMQYALSYHCCYCDIERIPSAFRLMVHLRKVHQSCDICLSRWSNQSELYSHMIRQHKINYLCYKCNLAWTSRNDINKHLFWKHGTEGVLCKRCLQKKWPHSYHFCIPASTYTCEECSRIFTKAVALTVHRRAHNNDFPFGCDDCDQRFISKKLLARHRQKVHGIEPQPSAIEESLKDEKEHTISEVSETKEQQLPEKVEEDKSSRRKKKRRKDKTDNEKPLLDELPPLNLSESDDESDDEEKPLPTTESVSEVTKVESKLEELKMEPLPSPKLEEQLLQQQENDKEELVEEKPKVEDPPFEFPIPPSVENELELESKPKMTEAELIEKILNCLVIEHSYCLPDSLFHTEPINQSLVSEGSELSPTSKCQRRDKSSSSCSKSNTPRKRSKRQRKQSSSSDSSSDSDSSSSSCGSNCSCNKSCSSSSSSGGESTTPEKRPKSRSVSVEKIEQNLLLNVAESDLETEIFTSDEDFYEEQPLPPPLPPPPHQYIPQPLTVAELQPFSTKITINKNDIRASKAKKSRKSKKVPKVTINLGREPKISLSRGNNVVHQTPTMPMRLYESSFNTTPVSSESSYVTSDAFTTPNYVNSTPVGNSRDSSGRASKRKRVKNKFYGYTSSDEELSGSNPAFRRKLPQPKMPKQPFVGIRAKKPLIPTLKFTNSSPQATSFPSPPVVSRPSHDTYRVATYGPPPNTYRPQWHVQQQLQQQQQVQPQRSFARPLVPHSSDDSSDDSDEKRHTLVIHLPNTKEKKENNSYRIAPSKQSLSQCSSINMLKRGNQSQSWPQRGPSTLPPAPGNPAQSNKIYCYCRCPYDEVSEMIACDAPDCAIEWFHFECVGIMVPPKGQWFCPNCRKKRENLPRAF